ncbi:hypothetical protein Bca101_036394 [Brassica carinata]
MKLKHTKCTTPTALQENIGILTDIPTENEILEISEEIPRKPKIWVSSEFPRNIPTEFRGNINPDSNHSKGTISVRREKGAEEKELKSNHTATKRRENMTNSTRLQMAEIVARRTRGSGRNFTSTNPKRSQTETKPKYKMKTLSSDRGKRLLRPPTLTHGHS